MARVLKGVTIPLNVLLLCSDSCSLVLPVQLSVTDCSALPGGSGCAALCLLSRGQFNSALVRIRVGSVE